MRDVTAAQFMQRYHVDVLQARRVGATRPVAVPQAHRRVGRARRNRHAALAWAARLHEIGISVAYSGYHKHSAYIINHAEMPGFSNDEQLAVSLLVLAHRRSLNKVAAQIEEHDLDWNMVFALRLAALFYSQSVPTYRCPPCR
jgi:exopolyphosphatase/guanosine-5'-triphosphate,3'-diphosphate pyrophosphatase